MDQATLYAMLMRGDAMYSAMALIAESVAVLSIEIKSVCDENITNELNLT